MSSFDWTGFSSIPKQETFDTCARGLLQQGRPSMRNGRCLYRGEGGTKCALGFLFDDNEYDELWDKPAQAYRAVDYLSRKGHDNQLMRDIVRIHDKSAPGYWSMQLLTLARDHGLNPAVVHATPLNKSATSGFPPEDWTKWMLGLPEIKMPVMPQPVSYAAYFNSEDAFMIAPPAVKYTEVLSFA